MGSEKKWNLRVTFDIAYEGEKLTADQMERLKAKVLDAGIDLMLRSKLDSKPLSYCMDIGHVGPDVTGQST